MYKVYRKDAYWWCKAILKYGLVVAFCSWLVSCYVASERRAEERERSREESKKCNQKLAGMELVPILGGGLLDIAKIPGFHFGSTTRNGQCIAELLEGSFWWTDNELRPTYQELGKKPSPNRRLFSVTARLYTRTASTEPYEVGLQTVDWPEELIVKLKNYPGLELWLDAPPPSVENDFSIKNFVISDWRRRDGTPRMIACNGLGSPSSEVLESGLNSDVLLTFNRLQLENLDFGRFNAYCTVELHDFDFAGGDARVHLGTGSLRAAPAALKFINEYLSRSIITGK
ncbi:hypothetical protein IB254_22170 [Pseudomonas sp. PDM03]|nr:hypothetical protein [Pseudomonas sp. PDM03]